MEIGITTGGINDQKTDAVVVNLFEGVKAPGGATRAVDRAVRGLITRLIEKEEIRGKANEITIIHTPSDAYDGFVPDRVVVVGLGKPDKFDLDRVRAVSAVVVRAARRIGARRIATITHGAGIGGLEPGACAEALVEGALLGAYRFDKYKSNAGGDNGRGLEELTIVEMDGSKAPALEAGATRGKILAEAAIRARDMANEPSNTLTPIRMAEAAQDIAAGTDGLECRVFERDAIEKLGMRTFLAVAQGSVEPPRLIEVTYRGDPDNPDNNIWLVGKGITFDSGGLSLKPSNYMEGMKGDMAGGAAVLGAIEAVAKLKPAINVTALVPATENMPSGSAQRVGDVVRTMSGKFVEVANTDAEGRLVLADAITYARENGARRIVDVATLTGAVGIALGSGNSGAFSNDDSLVAAVIAAGSKRGESMWRLPLDEVSKRQNESKIADVKNTGGRAAGAITGAHFIGEFVGDTPWVHLDIAATDVADKTRGWVPAGATGIPARSLVQLVLDLASGT
ncbi:MAG: leucyl aminopeptidase [Chloroflexi bacterium]|nr:leucyl aminopeptidase [Chloroflexota bacterium]